MPINFNQSLDTTTPNIPSYGAVETGMYTMSDTIDNITKLFTDMADKKAEQQAAAEESAAVSGIADGILNIRQNLIEGEDELQKQMDDARAGLNSGDAASVTQFQNTINRLRLQQRQLRRDNSALVTAELRRAIARYPHLTDNIIKAAKSGEEYFSDVFKEGDFDVVDKEDPAVKFAQMIEEMTIKGGVSPAVALDTVRSASRLERMKTDNELGGITGKNLISSGLSFSTELRKNLWSSLRFGRYGTQEAARADAYQKASLAIREMDNWIATQSKNGAIFGQQDVEMLRATVTGEVNEFVQFAANMVQPAIKDKATQDPEFIYTMTKAAAAFKDTNPAMYDMVVNRPEEYLKTYYKPMMDIVNKLKGTDFAKLQREAKGSDPAAAAAANAKLQALSRYVQIEQGGAIVMGGEGGTLLAQQYARILNDIQSGTFDPAKLPAGSVSEMLAVNIVFNPADNKPESEKARADFTIAQYKTSGVQGNYETGGNYSFDTRRRLLKTDSFVRYLNNNPVVRSQLVQNVQQDMIASKYSLTTGAIFDRIEYDEDLINAANWNSEQLIFTSKWSDEQTRKLMYDLTMQYRLLARWMESPQAAAQWMKTNVLGVGAAE